jgi:hypothetical protein
MMEVGMAISCTCVCGARLEIDDAFAGKPVPCPDCQRPLNTRVEKPRGAAGDLPVSGLALASLTLALVGGFIPPLPLVAIALGYLALRQIARAPDNVGGVNFARAGMILGGAFTLVSLGALLSGECLGIDSLLREFRSAADLDYNATSGGFYTASAGNNFDPIGIRRPSRAWGKLRPSAKTGTDLLTLVNLREDAHLLCLTVAGENEEGARDKAAQRFRESDLFKHLTKPGDAKGQSPEADPKPFAEGDKDDVTLELRLGGYDRIFLLRVVKVGAQVYLLAGGARKGRFARLSDEILQSFKSFKAMEGN